MMNYIYNMHYGAGFNNGFVPYLIPLIAVTALWTLFWKGLALWNASKRGEKVWFVVLLAVNSLGILEIVYLFLVKKIKWSDLW